MSMAYTDMAKKALKIANQTSKQMKHLYVGTEHILIGLIKEGDGVAASILRSFSIDEAQLVQLIEELIAPNSDVAIADREGYTPKTLDVLEGAEIIAQAYKSDGIGTEHILLSILQRRDCVAYKLLSTLGVNIQKMYVDTLTAMGIDKEAFEGIFRKDDSKERQQSLISNYSRDLTALAREGKLDPTIGRVEEIHRAIQILSRRGKNNPCLIGEPGVGKTAIVEGLASLIESGNVPETIKGKKILNLDLSSIVAGTKYRGEFEDRIKRIIKEVTDMGNIILFVDEIHTIIGAGGAEGALDASNILKPSLARGEIQLIGATTIEEYRKYIEKDAALERRFQPIRVEEPTEKEAVEILNGIKHKYEEHHNVIITDEAVNAAVNLANRYINDRFLPDKAIDILDEASAKAKLATVKVDLGSEDIEKEIAAVSKDFEQALIDEDMERAKELKAKKKELTEELAKKEKRKSARKDKVVTITEADIAGMVSEWTKIPLSKLEEKESARLENMAKVLHKRVIGQDEAVQAVVRAVKRGRVGLKDPHRPIGSFLFLGPTGVGKTELSKALAEALFNDEKSLIRVDMSEYMEKHSVSKIIGAPPGYVGHEEGGQLSEKVRRNPYSVILFDEIEKAHPDVFNILLQVLDDGHITDSQGRKVDFKNTIIIMTSNAGAQQIVEPKLLGFASKADAKRDYEVMKNAVMEEVKRLFKPEFLNRIDETIVFHALTADEMKAIVSLQTKILCDRAEDKLKIKLTVSSAVKEYIVKKAFDQKYGARPLKRMIQTSLEDALAEEILLGHAKSGDIVTVGLKKEKIVFHVKK